MSEYTQAVSDIRFIAARFKGFLAAAELLEQLGDIETAISEARRHLDALCEEQKQVQQAIVQAQAESEAQREALRATANQMVEDKCREAEDLIAKANEDGGRIVSAARDEAAGFAQQTDEHKKTIAGLRAEIDRLRAEVVEHGKTVLQAAQEAEAARQQLATDKAALRAFHAAQAAMVSE